MIEKIINFLTFVNKLFHSVMSKTLEKLKVPMDTERTLKNKRDDVIDALFYKFSLITQKLLSMRESVLAQYNSINLCFQNLNNSNFVENELTSLMNHAIEIQDDLMKQDEILYSCGMELKNAKFQNLCWPDAIDESSENIQFQKDCELISNSIQDIKKLMEEQSEIITELSSKKTGESVTVNSINSVINGLHTPEPLVDKSQISKTSQVLNELQIKYKTLEENFDQCVKEKNELQELSEKVIKNLQNQVNELTSITEEQAKIIENLEKNKENESELKMRIDEKDLQLKKYNQHVAKLNTPQKKEIICLDLF